MKNFLKNLSVAGGFFGFIAVVPSIIEHIEISTKSFLYILVSIFGVSVFYLIGKSCKNLFKHFIKRS